MPLLSAGAEIERPAGGQKIVRHHHEQAYAALVLRGGYVEAGDSGRVRAAAGNVLYHRAFEGHFNAIDGGGAGILNLPLANQPEFSVGICADPDAVVRMAQTDRRAAAALLTATTLLLAPQIQDWPDLLAAEIRSGRLRRFDGWAADHRLSPSAVSRGFALAYGVSPKRYRLEQRAAAAARALRGGAELGDTAFACGFADQPHMTRAVGSVFGRSPRQLKN